MKFILSRQLTVWHWPHERSHSARGISKPIPYFNPDQNSITSGYLTFAKGMMYYKNSDSDVQQELSIYLL
jgi:hypothetical protein